jgi:hypothetical protein
MKKCESVEFQLTSSDHLENRFIKFLLIYLQHDSLVRDQQNHDETYRTDSIVPEMDGLIQLIDYSDDEETMYDDEVLTRAAFDCRDLWQDLNNRGYDDSVSKV